MAPTIVSKYIITNTKYNIFCNKFFDVKDEFIPFILVLLNTYDIKYIQINRLDHKGNVSIPLEYLLDESTIENRIIYLNIALIRKASHI